MLFRAFFLTHWLFGRNTLWYMCFDTTLNTISGRGPPLNSGLTPTLRKLTTPQQNPPNSTLGNIIYIYIYYFAYTPPKTNMEPENGPLEKEIPIGFTIISRFHVCFGECNGCIFWVTWMGFLTQPFFSEETNKSESSLWESEKLFGFIWRFLI